eukprot:c20735_g3_i1.p1 GENE.c20735_g3_i1~~c20735_g3_i1.p1  ORF type:complete len:1246 (-),score=552.88 c20735_g3_i1:2007-5744(-)
MSISVNVIVEKMQASDRDFRYMAASDLLQEFQNPNFRFDQTVETKLADQLITLLKDTSADVQGLAVRCISALLNRASEKTTHQILNALLNNVINSKPEIDPVRDISIVTLKTAIPSLPQNESNGQIIRQLCPNAYKAIPKGSIEVQMEAVEVVNVFTSRFGEYFATNSEEIVDVLLPLLPIDRSVLRKRTTTCLATVCSGANEALFEKVVKHTIEHLNPKDPKATKPYLQLIVSLSGTSGQRFKPFLDTLITKILGLLQEPEEIDDDICEMLENCILAFQTFTQRCSKDMDPFVKSVLETCLKFIKFDPNYAMAEDDDGNDQEDAMDEDDEEDEDDDDDGGSDDYEDGSWKIRRASCHAISSILISRPDLLQSICPSVSAALLSRFSEREESVKLDVFHTFIDLIRQSINVSSILTETDELKSVFVNLVPKITKLSLKQIKEKSVKIRSGIVKVVKELLHVLDGVHAWQLHDFALAANKSMSDRTSTSAFKIDILGFDTKFFEKLELPQDDAAAAALNKDLKAISTIVFGAANEQYFKTTIAALEVCNEFTLLLDRAKLDASPFLLSLFDLSYSKFAAQEQDSEIKERAMLCMGSIISLFGNKLTSQQLGQALPVLLERLNNEIIRHSAVSAFSQILSSKLTLDISIVVDSLADKLGSFLRQSNRSVKQSSLLALIALASHYHSSIKMPQFDLMIKEASSLVVEGDVHMAGLALRLYVFILNSKEPKIIDDVKEKVVPKILALVQSPLLQGNAVDNLLDLIEKIVKINNKSLNFDALMEKFIDILSKEGEVHKASLSNISECIARLVLSTDSSKECDETVSSLISKVNNEDGKSTEALIVGSLFALGKIGRKKDLTSNKKLVPTIFKMFESQSEEVKVTASFALGSVAVGNIDSLVPVILQQIEQNQHYQYLLLHSVKEVIAQQVLSSSKTDTVVSSLSSVLPVLFVHANNEEEGVRNVVAECLGKLAILNPTVIVAEMQKGITNPAETTRATIITALKFAISSPSTKADSTILPLLPTFFSLIQDSSLLVRRAALISLNTAIHHKPKSLKSLQPLFGSLLKDTIKQEALIRQVQLGPFKHTVDDGLPVRKAAYECLDSLFEKAWHLLDLTSLVGHLIAGLDDDHDIKILTINLLLKVTSTSSSLPVIEEALDQLSVPLQKVVTSKPKQNAVAQEVERNQDLVRSGTRLVFALNKGYKEDSNAKFESLLSTIQSTPELKTVWTELSTERAAAFMKRRASSSMDIQ